MTIIAERPRRTTRYRPYGAPTTEPWQRAMDNPNYQPSHAAPMCVRGHATGSRPYAVPVIGTRDFVVYHGRDYLDSAGVIRRHPVRLTSWTHAQNAIAAHEAALTDAAPTLTVIR